MQLFESHIENSQNIITLLAETKEWFELPFNV